MSSLLLEVADLVVHYAGKDRGKPIRAVDGVNLTVRAGETVGLVGESGCGKTTTGRAIVGLVEATSGSVRFEGHELAGKSRRQLRSYRKRLQLMFQDPYSSLDPRFTAADLIAEPLIINHVDTDIDRRIDTLLDLVGLPRSVRSRYPHEFSGGQRQRIGIARAIALNPKLLILDEPVSALDVSIQSQVINLLADLQKELGLAYLFISHDLSVVKHISHCIAVMYLGKVVETGPADQVFTMPRHPYTKALVSAVPRPDPRQRGSDRIILQGDVPDPSAPPPGCRFHTRCWLADDVCRSVEPEPVRASTSDPSHSCHHPLSISPMKQVKQ